MYIFIFSLSFSQRFSCIIGPNGSGKSNVIDSMLFVFGYRAQKIRSKKLSVLIHSSDQHKDVQSCTVEVHFQKIIDKVYISISNRCTLHSLWPLLNWSIHSLNWKEWFSSGQIFFLNFKYFFLSAHEVILLHNYHTSE